VGVCVLVTVTMFVAVNMLMTMFGVAVIMMVTMPVFVVVLLLASVLVFAFVRHFLSPGFLILSYHFSPLEKFYNVSVGCLTKTNP